MAESPYDIIDTSLGKDGWAEIRRRFADGRPNGPLNHIISIARGHKIRSVLVEPFIDPHYRDEYSGFYATLFRRVAPTTYRLHFFDRVFQGTVTDLSELQCNYFGYSVMRPFSSHPVGRTMLVPPRELLNAHQSMVCAGEEEVHPYGYPLRVVAMPFLSSDGSYLRCGHAAQWMVLYHAYLAHDLPKRLPAEIQEASLGGDVIGRQLPSAGLSHPQILSSLHHLRMPAGIIKLRETQEDSRNAGIESLFATLCRYVNSQFPPIVVSDWHAWVVVGYRKVGTGPGHDCMRLWIHDDLRGPYLEVDDPWGHDELTGRGSWDVAIPPLPERLWFDAESAESTGTLALRTAAHDDALPAEPFLEVARARALAFRTYAIRSHQYKAGLKDRVGKEIELAFRSTRMAGTVWVVEALDRRLADAGKDAVLGEVVLDATAETPDDPKDPNLLAVLALHVAGSAITLDPKWQSEEDEFKATLTYWSEFAPYRSGMARRGLVRGRPVPAAS